MPVEHGVAKVWDGRVRNQKFEIKKSTSKRGP
jgi:hypothetical protein